MSLSGVFVGLKRGCLPKSIRRANLLAGIILAFGVIAAGVLSFSGFSASEPIADVESLQWTQESGAGIAVPACGSTTACGAPGQNVVCTTCVGPAPSVEFTWTNSGNTEGLTCLTTRIGAWVVGQLPSTAVRILDNLPCSGNAPWAGGANSTNYNYEVRYKTADALVCTNFQNVCDPKTGGCGDVCFGTANQTLTFPLSSDVRVCTNPQPVVCDPKTGGCSSPCPPPAQWVLATRSGHLINGGSFSTPNCTPAPVCSPSSVSLSTGQSQTFSVTDGSAPFTWDAPGSENPSGSGSTHATSYSSVAGSPYTVTVTDSASRTSQCSVTVNPALPLPTCSVSPPSVSGAAGSSQSVTINATNDADNRLPYDCGAGSWGSNPTGVAVGPFSFSMPNDSQSCTLTAQNSIGQTQTCPFSINVGAPSAYTLAVNSSGASSVAIAGNPAPYGGTTNYAINNITSGTGITLTAPATAGGQSFSGWTGCDSASGQTCTVTMNANKTVTANYAAAPPPPPTGDIDADGLDGPIPKTAGQSAVISWTSSNATTCRATPGGFTQGISNSGQSTGSLSSDVTYYLYCSNANYTDVPVDNVTINVSGAGLRPDYIVSSMSAPGSIRGGQTMTVNATIGNFGQRAYGGNTNAALCVWNTNQVNGAISVYGSIQNQIYDGGGCGPVDTEIIPPLNNAPTVPYLQNVTFNWTAWSLPASTLSDPRMNPMYAIVVADDGNLVFPELDDIINNVSWRNFTLLAPELKAGLTAVPDNGPEILSVSLQAGAWGTSLGPTADYFFWWTCTNTTTDVATAESVCGALPSSAGETIVDNSGGDTFSGNWLVGSGLNGVPYGADSLVSYESSANYRITPNVPSAGTYDVYFWYQGQACGVFGCPFGMPPTYPVTVFNGATSQTFNVPLRGGFFFFPIPPPPNGWYRLGNFSLPAGSSAYVQFGVNAGGANMGIADAIRLVPAVGACTTNSAGAKCLGVPTNTDPDTGEVFGGVSVPHDYNAAGSPYRPKVIVSSNGKYDQAQDDVTVSQNIADLIIRNPWVWLSNVAGNPIPFTAQVVNQGYIDAPASQARLRIDINNNGWTASEPELTQSVVSVPNVTNAPSNLRNTSWSWIGTCGGGTCTHSYQICADLPPEPNGVVTELSEANNCSPWNTFTVWGGLAPVLSASAVSCPSGNTTLLWNNIGVVDYEVHACLGAGCSGFAFRYRTTGTSDLLGLSPGINRLEVRGCTPGMGVGCGPFSNIVDVNNSCPLTSMSFIVNPGAIFLGGSSQLSWITSGFSSCTLRNADTGATLQIDSTPNSGNQSVSPLVTTDYSLTCDPGSVVDIKRVTVGAPPTIKEVPPR